MRISSAVCVVSAAELEKKKNPEACRLFLSTLNYSVHLGWPTETWSFRIQLTTLCSDELAHERHPSATHVQPQPHDQRDIKHCSQWICCLRVCVCVCGVEWNGVVRSGMEWSGVGAPQGISGLKLCTQRPAMCEDEPSLASVCLFFNQCSRVPCVLLSGLTTAAVFRFSPTVVAAASADFYALKSTLIPIFTTILHSLNCTQTSNAMSNCLLWSVDSESCRSCISGSE